MRSFPLLKRGVALITGFLFLWSLVLGLPREARSLSLSDEKELGQELLQKIKAHMALVEDGEILTYVRSVGNRIVKHVGTTPYEYQFFIVDESVPNAFAIPGGYIFIYRGLMEILGSEGELASILSHELAHIQARHIQRRLEEGRLLSVAALAGVLAGAFLGMGGGASQAVAMGSLAGAQSFQLKYSRENEVEADQLGLRYLSEAGYPAKDMASAMERLSQASWHASSRIPSYLSTHPALGERIQYLQELARKQEKPPSAVPGNSDDFFIMQAALISKYCDPHVAQERLQAISRQSKAAESFGLAHLYMRQGRMADVLPQLQQAACQASTSPFVLSSLGALYLQQGKLSEAQKVLQTALLLDPASPAVHLRLAQVYQEIGNREEALEHLHQLEELAPTFPEVDYQLGVLLGQMNRVGLAHFHLGRYYQQKQDWKLASFHYEKAKGLLQGSPEKMSELTQSLKEVEKKRKAGIWEKRKP